MKRNSYHFRHRVPGHPAPLPGSASRAGRAAFYGARRDRNRARQLAARYGPDTAPDKGPAPIPWGAVLAVLASCTVLAVFAVLAVQGSGFVLLRAVLSILAGATLVIAGFRLWSFFGGE